MKGKRHIGRYIMLAVLVLIIGIGAAGYFLRGKAKRYAMQRLTEAGSRSKSRVRRPTCAPGRSRWTACG
ncbi:MAG: hypothetical protein LBU95_03420 [Rikenellaceae bacterium]|jgi:hypothetical protein|nr:hypothetical protein [Rikenellaceae bacterium]